MCRRQRNERGANIIFGRDSRAEITKLRAVQGGSLTAGLSWEDVLTWLKRWADSYPLLARVARVVFGAPASAAVLELSGMLGV